MPRTAVLTTLLVVALLPGANAEGLIPVNPIVNGDFDVGYIVGGLTPARAALDHCVGVGHQFLVPLYSPWADYMIEVTNDASEDPTTLVGAVTAEDFAQQATSWPAGHAAAHVADPTLAVDCDPDYMDAAQLNPWNIAHDRGTGWSNDPGTTFYDFDDDGDVEAVIPRVPTTHSHSLWQSVATSTQAFSADFDAMTFALESGTIPPYANIQVGLSLSPSYAQHPFVGIFWEGAVLFRADDMVPDAGGVIRMDPIADGEIICPAYAPCLQFKAEYEAADAAGKHTLLGQTRIVQTSFWSFHTPMGPVVIDDVAYDGAKSMLETPPNVGP